MLRITRGDDKSFGVTLPGAPNLTGCTVFFTVKPEDLVDKVDTDDSNAVIKAQESVHDHPAADPANGKTVISLTAAVTGGPKAVPGEYVYDIQLKDSGGKIRTYKRSNGELPRCQITPEVTQRTT
jgi:hypothetical protein